jgi:hypothetical protein
LAETASLRHFAPDFSFFHRIQRAKTLAIWHVGCVQCCDTLDRVQPAIVDTEFKDFGAAVNAPAKFINRPEQHGSFDPESRMPPTLRKAAEMLADIMHSLVSSKFENMADQVRGSSPRRDAQLAIPAFSLRCGAEKARRDTRQEFHHICRC